MFYILEGNMIFGDVEGYIIFYYIQGYIIFIDTGLYDILLKW